MSVATITCPICNLTSANPNDVREGYCGNCHAWTSAACRFSPEDFAGPDTSCPLCAHAAEDHPVAERRP